MYLNPMTYLNPKTMFSSGVRAGSPRSRTGR
jgi:hypothetical protein